MTDDNTTSYNITQGLSYKNLEEHRYYSDEVTLPTTAAEVTGNTISNPKQATFDRIRLSYGEIDSITDKDGNALSANGCDRNAQLFLHRCSRCDTDGRRTEGNRIRYV